MKIRPKKAQAFTVLESLVVLAIVIVLIYVSIPRAGSILGRPAMTETLANARSLQQAIEMMTLDSQQSGEGIVLTYRQIKGGKDVPVSLTELFAALVKDGYLTDSDLRQVLAIPGRKSVSGPLTPDHIAFRIFRVGQESPRDQPFIVSANWEDGKLTSREPYGPKGFAYLTKGGSGGVRTRASDAESPDTFPTGSKDGHGYTRETLK